jgi:hypothetical protein
LDAPQSFQLKHSGLMQRNPCGQLNCTSVHIIDKGNERIMKKLIFYLLLVFTGCTTSTDNNNLLSGPISANRIKSVTALDQEVNFIINCTIPEPCWKYLRTDQEISGFNINMKIIGQRITNDPCLEVLSSLDAKPTIIVPQTGIYTFHFWNTNETSIDTTVVIQ